MDMQKFLMKLYQQEEGAETAEWLVIVALIVAIAITIFTGPLQTTLTGVVTEISGAVADLIP